MVFFATLGFTCQLQKNHICHWSGVLEKPYSGTFYDQATEFRKTNQMSPQVKSSMTHKFQK
jgi:hypothetical protein